jgi:hypothetical protein
MLIGLSVIKNRANRRQHSSDALTMNRLFAVGKVFASSRAQRITSMCRERLGAQGMFLANRVISYGIQTRRAAKGIRVQAGWARPRVALDTRHLFLDLRFGRGAARDSCSRSVVSPNAARTIKRSHCESVSPDLRASRSMSLASFVESLKFFCFGSFTPCAASCCVARDGSAAHRARIAPVIRHLPVSPSRKPQN